MQFLLQLCDLTHHLALQRIGLLYPRFNLITFTHNLQIFHYQLISITISFQSMCVPQITKGLNHFLSHHSNSLSFQFSNSPFGRSLRTMKGIRLCASSSSAMSRAFNFCSYSNAMVMQMGELLLICSALRPKTFALSYLESRGKLTRQSFSSLSSLCWSKLVASGSSIACSFSQTSTTSLLASSPLRLALSEAPSQSVISSYSKLSSCDSSSFLRSVSLSEEKSISWISQLQIDRQKLAYVGMPINNDTKYFTHNLLIKQ